MSLSILIMKILYGLMKNNFALDSLRAVCKQKIEMFNNLTKSVKIHF